MGRKAGSLLQPWRLSTTKSPIEMTFKKETFALPGFVILLNAGKHIGKENGPFMEACFFDVFVFTVVLCANGP